MEEYRDRQAPRRKNGRTTKIVLSSLIALLVIAVIVLFLIRSCAPKTQYEIDTDALEGMLAEGRTPEQIQELLNLIVEEGMFNVAINSVVLIDENNIGEVRIENVPGNKFGMQVDIVVTDSVGTEVTVYKTGVIKPGFSIERATFDIKPPDGFIDAVARFHAIDLDTGLETGSTSVTIVLCAGEQATEVYKEKLSQSSAAPDVAAATTPEPDASASLASPALSASEAPEG